MSHNVDSDSLWLTDGNSLHLHADPLNSHSFLSAIGAADAPLAQRPPGLPMTAALPAKQGNPPRAPFGRGAGSSAPRSHAVSPVAPSLEGPPRRAASSAALSATAATGSISASVEPLPPPLTAPAGATASQPSTGGGPSPPPVEQPLPYSPIAVAVGGASFAFTSLMDSIVVSPLRVAHATAAADTQAQCSAKPPTSATTATEVLPPAPAAAVSHPLVGAAAGGALSVCPAPPLSHHHHPQRALPAAATFPTPSSGCPLHNHSDATVAAKALPVALPTAAAAAASEGPQQQQPTLFLVEDNDAQRRLSQLLREKQRWQHTAAELEQARADLDRAAEENRVLSELLTQEKTTCQTWRQRAGQETRAKDEAEDRLREYVEASNSRLLGLEEQGRQRDTQHAAALAEARATLGAKADAAEGAHRLAAAALQQRAMRIAELETGLAAAAMECGECRAALVRQAEELETMAQAFDASTHKKDEAHALALRDAEAAVAQLRAEHAAAFSAAKEQWRAAQESAAEAHAAAVAALKQEASAATAQALAEAEAVHKRHSAALGESHAAALVAAEAAASEAEIRHANETDRLQEALTRAVQRLEVAAQEASRQLSEALATAEVASAAARQVAVAQAEEDAAAARRALVTLQDAVEAERGVWATRVEAEKSAAAAAAVEAAAEVAAWRQRGAALQDALAAAKTEALRLLREEADARRQLAEESAAFEALRSAQRLSTTSLAKLEQEVAALKAKLAMANPPLQQGPPLAGAIPEKQQCPQSHEETHHEGNPSSVASTDSPAAGGAAAVSPRARNAVVPSQPIMSSSSTTVVAASAAASTIRGGGGTAAAGPFTTTTNAPLPAGDRKRDREAAAAAAAEAQQRSSNGNDDCFSVLSAPSDEPAPKRLRMETTTTATAAAAATTRVFAITGFEGKALLRAIQSMPNTAVADGPSNEPVLPTVTHLVSAGPLTIKLLTALARRCWVLPERYVTDSIAAGTWLPEAQYGFRHEHVPLKGVSVCCTPTFQNSRYFESAAKVFKEGGALLRNISERAVCNITMCHSKELDGLGPGALTWEKMVLRLNPQQRTA